MYLSNHELRQLTNSVDEEHNASLHDLRDELEHTHRLALGSSNISRRGLLGATAAGGALLTLGQLAAPASRWWPKSWRSIAHAEESTTTTTAPPAAALTDKDICLFARSIEWATVSAYQLVTTGALASRITTKSVRETALAFASHHTDHALAFANLVSLNDSKTDAPTKNANAPLVADVADQLKAASNESAVLKVLFELENAASGTYLLALSALQSGKVIAQAASIAPIEAQHAVVWGRTLGFSTVAIDALIPEFEKIDAGLNPQGKFGLDPADPSTGAAKDPQ